jgi:hypothetical protein
MILKQNAQAVTELAILGTLIIVAFSFLINYSEKLNRQQANIHETFRAALAAAKNINNSAVYTKKVFLRTPNVNNPKELGQLDSFSDSASVLWKDGKDRDNVYVLSRNPINNQDEWRLVGRYAHSGIVQYQFDDESNYVLKNEETQVASLDPNQQRIENTYDAEGNLKIVPAKPKGTVVSTDSFVNEVDATTTLSQNSGVNGEIVTGKTLVATDTLTANVNIEGTDQTFTHTLGEGGRYSSKGGGISR